MYKLNTELKKELKKINKKDEPVKSGINQTLKPS
jgi:hypothetical protein